MIKGKKTLIVIIPFSVIFVFAILSQNNDGFGFLSQNKFDDFGIKKIYPTVKEGREWHANWDNGEEREIHTIKRDPYDLEMQRRGKGVITIDGEGIATISGKTPRLYVFDKSKPNWDNVEITYYGKRIEERKELSHQGFVAGARTEHQDANIDRCNGRGYYGRVLYDGRIGFQKELIHGKVYSPSFPKGVESNWDTKDGELPKDIWIGIKFIVFSQEEGVKLELYLDMKDGLNGGQWEKITEFLDNGTSINSNHWINVNKTCGFDEDAIIFEPGTSVFLRMDGLKEAEYKKFSIREISPPT